MAPTLLPRSDSRISKAKYVLRKKPDGIHPSSPAHNVDREFRILKGLGQYNASISRNADKVPVPKAYALCKDPSVLGTDFYVMGHLQASWWLPLGACRR
jgi:aminoglycoside phosphotransferase (APT) family kinase protein